MNSTRLLLLAALAAVPATAAPVINEIHADPPDKTKPVAFIEIHNPDAVAVSVAGWHLTDGIDFTFPSGTTIPAGGYVLVAENPAAFLTQFARTALGPWTGSLRKRGEQIQLRDAASILIDEVNFSMGFPWPTASAGTGASLELIHPSLDNDLAGSWRASGYPVGQAPDQVTYLAPGSGGWRWRPGSTEASAPVEVWRGETFVEDASWTTIGTPMGYGETFLPAANVFSGMSGVYRCIFLRRTFELTGPVPGSAVLRLKLDDGAVVWINGQEIGRPRYSGAVNSPVPVGGAFATNAPEPVDFEAIQITNAAGMLHAGTNVVTVQLFNSSLGSSDLVFDCELRSGFGGSGGTNPTPGVVNSSSALNAPPQIRQVGHLPATPVTGQPVIVTAKVTDPDGVSAVTLTYQANDPGAYIRKSDAAYATNWTALPMLDDGAGGDAVAGDSIYSATVPASVHTHRRLVRCRINVADTGSRSVLVPYADDECPNFAWLCYDGVPAWSGAIEPGVAGARGTVKNFPATLMNALPVYQLIANGTDVTNSQWSGGSDTVRMWGTLVYEGKVYDHVQFHNRGEASTYQCGKNKWRFHFNRTRNFEPRDNNGRRYNETWDDFSLNSCASPWIVANRGMAGLDESVSFKLYELAGLPSPRTHYLSFRVIDAAAEAPAPQYDGDLWGLYMAVESIDGSFLDERGLPDGSTYKIEGGGGDKKNQGATHPVNTSDWDTFRAGSTASATETWWRTNLNLPAYFSFHAVNRITGNVDIREGWNHCFYHHPDNRWIPVPWDLDMMYIAETHWSGTIDQRLCLNVAAINIEFKNRCREIMDLMCSDAANNGGQVGQVIDEMAQVVNPTGVALTWAVVDECMWNRHPRTAGGHLNNFYRTPYAQGQIGGTWNRTLVSADHEGFVAFLKGYTTDTDPNTFLVGDGDQRGYGFNFLEQEAADTNVPFRPVITHVGAPGFPANDLRFQSSAFSAPAGVTFSAMQWRVAEIAAPGLAGFTAGDSRKYEIEETWTSGELTAFAADTRVPTSVAQPGRTFRARVRLKGNNGRWSQWSLPVQFVAGTPDVSVYLNSLVVSEMMYHPAGPTPAQVALGYTEDDFEFIEIKNTAAAPVDLTDVRFTKGINFDFAPATTVAPGAFLLLVRNQAAFESRYGTGKPVAGTFATDKLSNDGEEIKLSYGAGTAIRSFVYSDDAPWPLTADGDGPALVLIAPNTRPDHTIAANWRASWMPGGSPGADDLLTFAAWALIYPAAADPAADADSDGVANRAEYFYGTHPLESASSHTPSGSFQTLSPGGTPATYLTVTFSHRSEVSDITPVVEFSPDMTTWTGGAVLVSITPGSPLTTTTWRSPLPVDSARRHFVKVVMGFSP